MDSFTTQGRKEAHHRHVLLLTHPRTASNLFTQLLSTQPGWTQKEYHFRTAFTFSRTTNSWNEAPGINDDDRRQFEGLFQRGFTQLCLDRDGAVAEGKRLMVKTHAMHLWEPAELRRGVASGLGDTAGSNPTMVPDEFLASWQAVFLIRHPALVFESWYRAETRVAPIKISEAVWSCFMTFGHVRRLYDWFAARSQEAACGEGGEEGGEQGVGAPIVIDADDVIEGDLAMSRLCEMCGMDPSRICREWEATTPLTDLKLSTRHLVFMSGFWASTCVDKSKTSRGLDVAARHEQWRDEFGEEVAVFLMGKVEDAMLDYEYLRGRSL